MFRDYATSGVAYTGVSDEWLDWVDALDSGPRVPKQQNGSATEFKLIESEVRTRKQKKTP